jgi:hypothetical protein
VRPALVHRIVIAALVAGAAPAAARAERLIIAVADPELERATSAALAAWSVEIVVKSDANPGPTMPQAAETAEALASSRSARAVVWTASASGRPSLWLYDVTTRKAVSVPLAAPPPFDAPTAAAVALSIKTLLRYSAVAPPAERYAPPPPPARHLVVQAMAGARIRSGSPVEPAAGLGLVVRPRRLDPLDLFAAARAGAGIRVERGAFSGRHDDVALVLGARLGVALGRRASLHPLAGLGLHLDSLRGSDAQAGDSAAAIRFNPSAELGLHVELEVGPLRIGLFAETSIRARRQRFLVAGAEVYDLPIAMAQTGATAGLPF